MLSMMFPLAFSLPLKNACKEEGKEWQTLSRYILSVFLKDLFFLKSLLRLNTIELTLGNKGNFYLAMIV